MPLVRNPEKRRQAMLNHRTETTTFPEYKILNALVQQPHDTSVADAVQQIVDLTKSRLATGSLGVHPWHTFLSLLELGARTAPDHQSKLAECIAQLQKVKVIDPTTGEQIKHNDDPVWTGLPALGYTAGDEWFAFDINNTDPEDIQRWENTIALFAHLSAAADVDYSGPSIPNPMDFSFWSTREFQQAFKPLLEEQKVPADVIVRTACLWMIYASDRLWANVQYGREDPDVGFKFTPSLWEYWGKGLRAAQGACSNEATKKLVDDALAQMKRAEEEGKR